MSVNFTALEKREILVKKSIEIVSLRYLYPSASIDQLRCSACGKPVGSKRPLASIWDGNRSWRVCNGCISHLEEDDFLHCPNCKLSFPSVEGDTFWWGGGIHPDTENCRCPGCEADTITEDIGYTFTDFLEIRKD
jgi:hypothetical protein